MAKLEAEVGTSPESEKESSSENIVKLHEEARKTTPVEIDCESLCSCRRYRSDGCGDGDFGWGEEGSIGMWCGRRTVYGMRLS